MTKKAICADRSCKNLEHGHSWQRSSTYNDILQALKSNPEATRMIVYGSSQHTETEAMRLFIESRNEQTKRDIIEHLQALV